MFIYYMCSALVGYSPRMNAFDSSTGLSRYLRWQHTWWSGLYSIVLTKEGFLHRDYLDRYFEVGRWVGG